MLTKENFPIFKNNPNLIYLDSAATSQKPKFVLDQMINWYTHLNANPGRGLYNLSLEANRQFEQARQTIANVFQVDRTEVIFSKGATEGINLLARGIETTLKPGQSIVISDQEHHSNYLPWLRLAQKLNLELKILPSQNNLIDLDQAIKIIDNKTAIVAVTHASNVLGQINPIQELSQIAHQNGAWLIVDGAQIVAHQKTSPWKLGCDAYVFSGHKVYSEFGSGVVLIKQELADQLNPLLVGGEMVESVHQNAITYRQTPAKFEAGTQNPAAQIGLSLSLQELNANWPQIKRFEHTLHQYLLQRLTFPQITIHNPTADLPIVTFSIQGLPAHDVASYLNEKNIAVRVGFLCSQPLVETLNTSGVVRVSLGLWNEKNDIDQLILALEELTKLL